MYIIISETHLDTVLFSKKINHIEQFRSYIDKFITYLLLDSKHPKEATLMLTSVTHVGFGALLYQWVTELKKSSSESELIMKCT